jgi:small subunit ribosomal protein S16
VSVKLRLRRMGTTNRPFYRVVAIDSRKQRDGRTIEELGFYDPLRKPAAVQLQEEQVLQWLERGAQPSATVRRLLQHQGLLQKRHLMQRGTSAAAATQAVAERLQSRPVRPRRAKKGRKAAASPGS